MRIKKYRVVVEVRTTQSKDQIRRWGVWDQLGKLVCVNRHCFTRRHK